jgi:hypothetical protein
MPGQDFAGISHERLPSDATLSPDYLKILACRAAADISAIGLAQPAERTPRLIWHRRTTLGGSRLISFAEFWR